MPRMTRTKPRDPAVLDPQRRYYWHLTSQAAAPFLAAATSMLNAASVPFRLKVLSDPDAYTRADAGVLYLRRSHALAAGDAIARIHETVAAGLRQEIPLLTFRLADGLALAESPPTGSYGQHRCRLIASALWRSHACGDDGREARLAAMAEAWRAQGLDAEHPYLAPGSTPGDLPAAATTGSVRAAVNGRFGGIRPCCNADRDASDLTACRRGLDRRATLPRGALGPGRALVQLDGPIVARDDRRRYDRSRRRCDWGPIFTADRLASPFSWRSFTRLLAMPRAVARRSEQSLARSGLPGKSQAVFPRLFRCSWASLAWPMPPGALPH